MTSRLTRPRRTKMYDCNYRMGERNYRPVLDDLDRKYSGGGGGSGGGLSTLRGALAEAEATLPTRRDATPDERRSAARPLSSLLDDDDSFFDVAARKSTSRRQALLKLEDGLDSDLLEESSGSRRLRDSRKRIAAIEEEIAGRRTGGGVDFADKVLDTVGLGAEDMSKARQYLLQRRKVTVSSSGGGAASDDEEAAPKAFTKWTKLGDRDREQLDVGAGGGAAAARARKSRARLQDIENEMEELADRAAARERRSANVRALLQETAEVGSASSSVQTSSVRVRKVAASTEKTVSF